MRNIILFGSIIAVTSASIFSRTVPPVTIAGVEKDAVTVKASGDEARNLITKGSWKIKSIISDKPCDTDGDGKLTTDIASEMPECGMDDIMSIQPNGKVIFKRFMRCSPVEKAVEEYSWKLTGDDKFIISRNSIDAEMLFKYVTNDELVLIIPSEAMGEMYYFTVTYTRPG